MGELLPRSPPPALSLSPSPLISRLTSTAPLAPSIFWYVSFRPSISRSNLASTWFSNLDRL